MEIRQGIDIVSVARIKSLIERQGARVLNRIYTRGERAYCDKKRMKFEHYAARFAAKEAFIKAVSSSKKAAVIDLNAIEVKHYPTGKPYIPLTPRIKKIFNLSNRCRIEVSLSHERDYAVAAVLLADEGAQ